MKGNGERTPPSRRAVGAAPEPEPGRGRRARLAKHAGRAALLLAVAAVVYLLFPGAHGEGGLERGTVSRRDLVARFPFVVPKTEPELRRERDEAAAGVPPVFAYSPGGADTTLAGLTAFFRSADSALAIPGADARATAMSVLERARIPVTLGSVQALGDSARRAALRGATERAVRETLPRGVAHASLVGQGTSVLRVRRAGTERLLPADSILSAERLYASAAAALPAEAGADAAELQRLLLIRYFRPTLVPDAAATDAARARARAAVDTVAATVLPGEKVVAAGQQVGEREEARLRAYQAAAEAHRETAGGTHTATRAAGAILYNALLLCILGALLRLSRNSLYDDDRAVIFLALCIVTVAGLAAVIARADFPPELIPVPFVALLLAVLWGGRLALASALVLALLIGGQPPFVGLAVPFSLAVTGAAAAFGVRVAERRLQTWLVIAIIAAAGVAAAVATGLLRSRGMGEIGWSALWMTANAVASSLLAVGVLPLAEWFTRVTTNQTLMELANPNQPLLKRLAFEAPGTYAHTISVANLAESVCNAIGANALLARVGVYYHDVGKVAKPQFFIENQPRGRNPHDKLKPSMSAAIVRSHVVEGLRLADEARLPAAVKAFITEHHGTQQISFFLDQAKAGDPECRVNAADFAYAGPRPQSRETAVVMLSDSVESATRALADPTPQRIRELVERIVTAKIAAGQLDESPLTLREIGIAKDVLAKGLLAMYHHRLDYPAAPAPSPADTRTSAGRRSADAPGDADASPDGRKNGKRPKDGGVSGDVQQTVDVVPPAGKPAAVDLSSSGSASADAGSSLSHGTPADAGVTVVDGARADTGVAPVDGRTDDANGAGPIGAGTAKADGAGTSKKTGAVDG